MFAKPKVRVRLRRRDKRVKRHKRLIERYHRLIIEKKYKEYYKDASF